MSAARKLEDLTIGEYLALGDKYRTALDAENITVLRKTSKGLVKSGYSLKRPELIDAILFEASADPVNLDVVKLIKKAKA